MDDTFTKDDIVTMDDDVIRNIDKLTPNSSMSSPSSKSYTNTHCRPTHSTQISMEYKKTKIVSCYIHKL